LGIGISEKERVSFMLILNFKKYEIDDTRIRKEIA
jgi:hypothetical protein